MVHIPFDSDDESCSRNQPGNILDDNCKIYDTTSRNQGRTQLVGVTDGDMRIRQLAEEYLQYRLAQGLQPGTIVVQRAALRRFVEYAESHGATTTGQITERLTVSWVASLNVTSSTIHGWATTLRTCLRYGRTHGMRLALDPARVPIPDPHYAQVTPLTEAEVHKLLTAARSMAHGWRKSNVRNLVMLCLMLETGIRVGELRSLRLMNIERYADRRSGVYGAISVRGKGGRFRRCGFGERTHRALVAHLKEWRITQDNQLLFPSDNDPRIPCASSCVYRALKVIAHRAGIRPDIHPHLLRHSAATHLIRQGENLYVVSRLLGHARIQTTVQYYLHLADSEVEQAGVRASILNERRQVWEL